MYVKIHHSYRRVVSICDSDLIGKRFEEGKKQLDVRENFYRGDEFSEDKVVEIIKKEKLDDSTFNIVGEESVEVALKCGIISEGNIGNVDGVPFALLLI